MAKFLKQLWKEYVTDILGNEKGFLQFAIPAAIAAIGAGLSRRQRKKAERAAEGVTIPTEYPEPAAFPARTPEETRLWGLSTGQLGDIMERPTGALSPFARGLYEEQMRQLQTKAAPGFFARGMGGQAGAAGFGAFQAREAPGQYLQAFGAGEEIERGRRGEARGFLETGLGERQALYSPEAMRFQSAVTSVEAKRQNALSQRQTLLAKAKQYGITEQQLAQIMGQIISGGFGGGGGSIITAPKVATGV